MIIATSRILIACSALLVALVALNGCGGGSGLDTAHPVDPSVAGSTATTPPYVVLDLSTGLVSGANDLPGLASDPAYRDTLMAFRLVSGVGQTGTPANGLGAVIDPPVAQTAVAPYYLAVFETSQGQWRRLAGTTPWTTLVSATSTDDVRVGDTYPAIGISAHAASAACATYAGAARVTLALPSDAQWEIACRAGSTGSFSWDDTATPAQIGAAALVWETAGGNRGARPVGVGDANAFGLYDMHGNVWELTQETHLRGGSWNDPLATARAANLAPIDPTTAHLLVGVRFVYVPPTPLSHALR